MKKVNERNRIASIAFNQRAEKRGRCVENGQRFRYDFIDASTNKCDTLKTVKSRGKKNLPSLRKRVCHTSIFILQKESTSNISTHLCVDFFFLSLRFRYLFHSLHRESIHFLWKSICCCESIANKKSRTVKNVEIWCWHVFVLCYVNWYTCQMHENNNWYHHVLHSVIFSFLLLRFVCVCESIRSKKQSQTSTTFINLFFYVHQNEKKKVNIYQTLVSRPYTMLRFLMCLSLCLSVCLFQFHFYIDNIPWHSKLSSSF